MMTVRALRMQVGEDAAMNVGSREKARRREHARYKARYGPRGGVSDRRPAVVRDDRGAVRRLRKAMDRAAANS
jgi:hypothetical protein